VESKLGGVQRSAMLLCYPGSALEGHDRELSREGDEEEVVGQGRLCTSGRQGRRLTVLLQNFA
jgi:hypothetical protein